MRTLALTALLAMTACAIEGEDAYEVEVPGVDYSDLERGEICPAIAILCAPGYEPKSMPNCRQMCVPAQECDTDADCPTIYCLTEPCPQLECRGHDCVIP